MAPSIVDSAWHAGTAAILAVGASRPTVTATEDGLIGVKKIMSVNLTADHRLVYGAQAAEFLQVCVWLKRCPTSFCNSPLLSRALQTLKDVIEHPDQLVM